MGTHPKFNPGTGADVQYWAKTYDQSDSSTGGTVVPAVLVEAGENHIGSVGGDTLTPSGSFNRSANTTQYAVGGLVANNTVAGSVTPLALTVARKNDGTGIITNVNLTKSGTSLTQASFRVHFYSTLPTVSNGDGNPWLTTRAGYLGYADVTMDKAFSDGAGGAGVPKDSSGNPRTMAFKAATGTQLIYALVEARGTYTPLNAETFTVIPEVSRD